MTKVFTDQLAALPITEIIIRAIEGGLYIAFVALEGRLLRVFELDNKPLCRRSVGDIKKGGESEVKDELEKRLEALLDEAIGVTVQGRPPLEARVRDKRVMENRDVIAYNIIAITHDRAVISQIPGYKYPSPKNTSRADDTIMETVFVEQVPVKKENLCEFFLTSIPG